MTSTLEGDCIRGSGVCDSWEPKKGRGLIKSTDGITLIVADAGVLHALPGVYKVLFKHERVEFEAVQTLDDTTNEMIYKATCVTGPDGTHVACDGVATMSLGYVTRLFYTDYQENRAKYQSELTQLDFYKKQVNGYDNSNASISTQNVTIRRLKPNLNDFIGLDIESLPIRVDLQNIPQTKSNTTNTTNTNELSACEALTNTASNSSDASKRAAVANNPRSEDTEDEKANVSGVSTAPSACDASDRNRGEIARLLTYLQELNLQPKPSENGVNSFDSAVDSADAATGSARVPVATELSELCEHDGTSDKHGKHCKHDEKQLQSTEVTLKLPELLRHCEVNGININTRRIDPIFSGMTDAMRQICNVSKGACDPLESYDIVTERHNMRQLANVVINGTRGDDIYIGCFVSSSSSSSSSGSDRKRLQLVTVMPQESARVADPVIMYGHLLEHALTSEPSGDKSDIADNCKNGANNSTTAASGKEDILPLKETLNQTEVRCLLELNYKQLGAGGNGMKVLVAAETDGMDANSGKLCEIKCSKYKSGRVSKHFSILNMHSSKILKIWSQCYFGGVGEVVIAYRDGLQSGASQVCDIKRIPSIEAYVEEIVKNGVAKGLDQGDGKDTKKKDKDSKNKNMADMGDVDGCKREKTEKEMEQDRFEMAKNLLKAIDKCKFAVGYILNWLMQKCKFMKEDSMYCIEFSPATNKLRLKALNEHQQEFERLIKMKSTKFGLVYDKKGNIRPQRV